MEAQRRDEYAYFSSVDLLALYRQDSAAARDDNLWRELLVDLSPSIAEWAESADRAELERLFVAIWGWRGIDKPWPFWFRLYVEIRTLGENPPSIQWLMALKNEEWPLLWVRHWQAINDALEATPLLWALVLYERTIVPTAIFASAAPDEVLQELPEILTRLSGAIFPRTAEEREQFAQLEYVLAFDIAETDPSKIHSQLEKEGTLRSVLSLLWRSARANRGIRLRDYSAAIRRVAHSEENYEYASLEYVRAALLARDDDTLGMPLSDEMRDAIAADDVGAVEELLFEERAAEYEYEDLIAEAVVQGSKNVESYLRQQSDLFYISDAEEKDYAKSRALAREYDPDYWNDDEYREEKYLSRLEREQEFFDYDYDDRDYY